jgi:hypothetical protein
MISIAKGKTEIPHNPTDASGGLFIYQLSFADLFYLLQGPQVHRPDIHVPSQGHFPLYGRLSLGQPSVLETLEMACSFFIAHAVHFQQGTPGRSVYKQLYVTAVKEPIAAARNCYFFDQQQAGI